MQLDLRGCRRRAVVAVTVIRAVVRFPQAPVTQVTAKQVRYMNATNMLVLLNFYLGTKSYCDPIVFKRKKRMRIVSSVRLSKLRGYFRGTSRTSFS